MRAIAVITTLTMGGAAGNRAAQPDPLTVRIRLEVDRSLRSRHIVRDLEAETASLWGPYGVLIAFADADGAADDGDADAFVVDARIQRLRLSDEATVLGTADIGTTRRGRSAFRSTRPTPCSRLDPTVRSAR